MQAVLALAAALVAAASTFDGGRAFRDLSDLVSIGARASHSEGARRARTLIGERLRQAGFTAREDAFQPGLANVIGERRGASDDLVLVVTHFDSRTTPAANESASGPALLLELARSLSGADLGATVWLVFLDGHELEHAGSRALAARMEREGTLARIRALLVIERVGDTDLRLETSVLASRRLLALARSPVLDPIARAHFDGDHLAFVRKGVREILPLGDPRFGPGDPPGAWTHTPADDLRHVSAASLVRAGELVRRIVLEVANDSRVDLHAPP